MNGDSFPSRVGASLLTSFSCQNGGATNLHDSFATLEKTLVMESKKSFEDAAIRLMAAPQSLNLLRQKLDEARTGKGAAEYVTTCDKSGMARQATVNGTTSPVGFFNTIRLVSDFRRAMEATSEASAIRHSRRTTTPLSRLPVSDQSNIVVDQSGTSGTTTLSAPPLAGKRVSSHHPHILVGH